MKEYFLVMQTIWEILHTSVLIKIFLYIVLQSLPIDLYMFKVYSF